MYLEMYNNWMTHSVHVAKLNQLGLFLCARLLCKNEMRPRPLQFFYATLFYKKDLVGVQKQ